MVAVLIVVYALCYWWLCGGGGGGGGGDSSAARCWSIDPAREIGIHGVRADVTKDVRRHPFHPSTNSNAIELQNTSFPGEARTHGNALLSTTVSGVPGITAIFLGVAGFWLWRLSIKTFAMTKSVKQGVKQKVLSPDIFPWCSSWKKSRNVYARRINVIILL